MNNQTIILVVKGILKSHNITDEMVIKYYTRTYNSTEEGIPARYFYSLMDMKLNKAIQIAIDLTSETTGSDKEFIVTAVRKEFVGG